MQDHVGEVGHVIEEAMTGLNAYVKKPIVLRVIVVFEQ